MADWQPIDTAPMNEVILVWLPTLDSEGETIGAWPAVLFPPDEFEQDGEVWVSVASWDDGRIGWSVTSPKPTHWMPLPAPPASADTLPKGQDAEERLDAKQG